MIFFVNLLITLAVGALAGWMAGKFMKVDLSLLSCILLGIAGSIVGGVVAFLLGFEAETSLASFLVKVGGACLSIYLYKKFVK